jgi:hypothetical protein
LNRRVERQRLRQLDEGDVVGHVGVVEDELTVGDDDNSFNVVLLNAVC